MAVRGVKERTTHQRGKDENKGLNLERWESRLLQSTISRNGPRPRRGGGGGEEKAASMAEKLFYGNSEWRLSIASCIEILKFRLTLGQEYVNEFSKH